MLPSITLMPVEKRCHWQFSTPLWVSSSHDHRWNHPDQYSCLQSFPCFIDFYISSNAILYWSLYWTRSDKMDGCSFNFTRYIFRFCHIHTIHHGNLDNICFVYFLIKLWKPNLTIIPNLKINFYKKRNIYKKKTITKICIG